MTVQAAKRNAHAAILIESALTEADGSSDVPWASVDKSKLPAKCFLWVEDPTKKDTWHLPYREGAGSIGADGMYTEAGPVNKGALRAIAAALGGARTGKPMNVPAEIKQKITGLMKRYKIGGDMKESVNTPRDAQIRESSLIGELSEASLDADNGVLRGMAILRKTSKNHEYYKEATGRDYTDRALQEAARMATGIKCYRNHQGKTQAEDMRGCRRMEDLIGVFENGRVENNVAKADLRYLQAAPVKEFVEALIKLNAPGVGNSILANGEIIFDKANKREIINSLREMKSIDLVSETGSTINLFESAQEVDEMDMTTITLADLVGSRPDIVQQITESVKNETGKEDQIKTLVQENASLKKENGELKKKVDDFQVKEQLTEKKAAIEKELAESKLDSKYVTPVLIESLGAAATPEDRKKIIEDRKTLISESTKGIKGAGEENKTLEESKATGVDEDLKKKVSSFIG